MLRDALRQAMTALIDFRLEPYARTMSAYRILDAALSGKPLSEHHGTEPQTPAEWKLLAGKLTDEIGELREDKTVALTAAMLLASKMAKKYYPETPGYKPPAEIGTVLVHIEDMLSKLVRMTTPPKGAPQ